jgi:DNA-binding transcriptional MerR regulator
MENVLTIREAAARTGITPHTLRYYERIGLVKPVARARSGHRRYGEADLRWIELLKKLNATDMPIRKMLEYARLVWRGDSTVAARRALLEQHRRDVEAKLAEVRESLGAIERKIAYYDHTLLSAGHDARPRDAAAAAAAAG